jgi:hypothetical protein
MKEYGSGGTDLRILTLELHEDEWSGLKYSRFNHRHDIWYCHSRVQCNGCRTVAYRAGGLGSQPPPPPKFQSF